LQRVNFFANWKYLTKEKPFRMKQKQTYINQLIYEIVLIIFGGRFKIPILRLIIINYFPNPIILFILNHSYFRHLKIRASIILNNNQPVIKIRSRCASHFKTPCHISICKCLICSCINIRVVSTII
jgi:hypothetical protein